jgi:hypothetical protein
MSEEAELLQELSTLDECDAWIPTNRDHVESITPPWCELVFEVKRTDDGSLTPSWPLNVRMPLRRHDGELMIQALHDALHPNAGGSVREMLWAELDDVVDRIQKRVNKDKPPRLRDVGQAQGLALALAILVNPFAYDVDAIRAEAMARYDARNGMI